MPEEEPLQEQAGPETSVPARKRRGAAALVPFTVMVEPADLSTVEAISKASRRSMGDVMREMLSYGMEHMLEKAFAPADVQKDDLSAAVTDESEPKPPRRRTPVSAAMDSDALAVLSAMAGDERGARSDVLRRAIAEGLALTGGSVDD